MSVVEIITNGLVVRANAAYNNSVTSISVTLDTNSPVAAIPAIATGQQLRFWWDGEIIVVTVNSGAGNVNFTTIARGQEGTTAISHLINSQLFQIASTAGIAQTVEDGMATHGGYRPLDIAPTSPTAFDDEFDSQTLAAKWGTPGSVTDGEGVSGAGVSYDVNTTWRSCLQARINSTGTASFVVGQTTVPSGTGAFQVTCKFIAQLNVSFMGFNFYFMDSTKQNGIRVGCEFNGACTYGLSCESTFSTKDSNVWTFNRSHRLGPQIGIGYLQLQRDGSSNWRAFISHNGYHWYEITAGNYNKSFTVDNMQMSFKLSGATVDTRMACDWIRFNLGAIP